ncbi:MAG: DUF1294 domain-containing protein [Ruminococcaceae bacterium]|nr:DUF1294 domain-containing protein [Oscillospiraceae bacterium]
MILFVSRGGNLDFYTKLLIIYLIVINLFSCFVCIVDKHNAKNGYWRVSEKSLIILSALGGSVAMYITMRLISHKTLHKRFMIGIPLIIVIQIIILFVFAFGIDKIAI